MKLSINKEYILELIKKFHSKKHIYIPVYIASFLFLYFSYHALFGNKGVIKYFSLSKELEEKKVTKNKLKNQVIHKQNLVDGMSTKSLDVDLLDEQAREKLGYAKKNEVIIYEKE